MKKKLLIVCILLGSIASFGQTIPVDEYGNILLGDYENYADNQKVKIVLSISNAEPNTSTAVGYGVGTINPINKEVVTNEDWTNDAAYNFICKAISEAGEENVYELTIADLKNFAKVDGEYYEDSYGQKGLSINLYNGASLISITVGAAAQASAVLDFEADEVGVSYPGIAWSPEMISAVVATDPADVNGKSLHVTSTNWNSYPLFTIHLPDGKTVADIEKITFNLYLGTGGSADQNSYKHFDYFVGTIGTSFTANEATGKTGNIITSDATNVWLKKDFNLAITDEALLALNSFDFALGIEVENADYYLDNITLVAKAGANIVSAQPIASQVYNVAGGILVNANNEKVSVYSIDGRLVKQAVANNSILSLAPGLYIVKVGAGIAVKVLVK
jgi:hypothetical protein